MVKSDLGTVFGFQIPTAARVYQFKASSAKSIDRWLSVLNANVRRIQTMSSRFVDQVFRTVILGDTRDTAVLRSGREYNTLATIVRGQSARHQN